ncbi:helix-turn-helix domain-containing protein [Aquimarina sp. RZ0]|uniref:winged helix-turn-helix transcriptional regulator n=1 Tax=Aquimarina sp. RZ0 TaxID=2607730 RepID=UPI0011F27306|nr:helix-turn-helix domain-containing protein [Aquimarina sp. RZ0]KAA1239802.1 helix-turn-helix transcriptional regulator [Aquimarina sp. RZ0]
MTDFKEISDCPITTTLSFIGGRWKTIILYIISDRTFRFGEISARIPAISRKVLTEQLKELVKDGILNRQKFNETPPRVEYSVTEFGKSLKNVLSEMEKWGFEFEKHSLKEK